MKGLSSLLFLGLFLTCSAFSQADSEADRALLQPLAEKGIVLSDQPPLEGYHSPKEVILNARRDLRDAGELRTPPGNYRGILPPYEVYTSAPIMVHDFIRPKYPELVCDFVYVVYDLHPDHGVTKTSIYEYNRYSACQEGFVRWVKSDPNKKRYFLSQKDAIQYMERKFNTRLERKPIAAYLPLNHWVDGVQGWLWYFQIQGQGEFLLSGFLYPYKPHQDLFTQIEAVTFGEHGPTMLFKPPFPLNLYERLERKKRDRDYDWYLPLFIKLIPYRIQEER